MHEKGLQRQIGVGTLVSSQGRRALAVPLVNRLSTAGQPLVNRGSTADFVPPSVYIGFRLIVLPKRRPGQCLRFAGGQERGLSPGRIDPTASRPTQPRPPSPPRRAPPRPDRPVVCPGFGFDRFFCFDPPVICPGFGRDKYFVQGGCLHEHVEIALLIHTSVMRAAINTRVPLSRRAQI